MPLPASLERTEGVQTRYVDLHHRFHVEREPGNRSLMLVDGLHGAVAEVLGIREESGAS